MQPIWQQNPVKCTVRCKNYVENAVKSTVCLSYLQYIILCMFLQYIGLKNCKIVQCTVRFLHASLYFLKIQCTFYRGLLADWLHWLPAFLL